jgi:hypothetical protein
MTLSEFIASLQHAQRDGASIVAAGDDDGNAYSIERVEIESGEACVIVKPWDEQCPDEFSDDEELSHDSNGSA